MSFQDLPQAGRYQAILADPPWKYAMWEGSDAANGVATAHYQTAAVDDLGLLPVADLAAKNCVLFIWITWPLLPDCLDLISRWGFTYKTCAFSWMKADASQLDLLRDDMTAYMGLGMWTRANSEVCLLATREKPKRLNADVRQGIIAPRREHSRKPDGVHERIERLVAGPYVELFARQQRPGWDCWGNETDRFVSSRPSPYGVPEHED